MKDVIITLTMQVGNDVPQQVLDWMADNVREHAETEFGEDYDPDFTEGVYLDEPLKSGVDVAVAVVRPARGPTPQELELIAELSPATDKLIDQLGLRRRTIDLLGLRRRTVTYLRKCLWRPSNRDRRQPTPQIATVADLLHWSVPDLLSLRWVGRKDVYDIRDALAREGLYLPNRDVPQPAEIRGRASGGHVQD